MKNIKLIEVPSEIGAGTRGASLGIEAIKIAALDFMSNFFIHFPSEKIPVENKLLYEPIESPYAKRIKGIVSMYDKTSKAVSDCIKGNFFPVGFHGYAGQPGDFLHLFIGKRAGNFNEVLPLQSVEKRISQAKACAYKIVTD